MTLSKKQLQHLGKRLRTSFEADDVEILNTYRRWFDSSLLNAAFSINKALSSSGRPYLLSGRAKRTKSIIRKLVREPTMDLSRMADIVGLRVIVKSLDDQQDALRVICDLVKVQRVLDHTVTARPYRAIHVLFEIDGRVLEIQIRTLAQQIWADESESFGEQAKEGNVTDMQRDYLSELRETMRLIDVSGEAPPMRHPLAVARQPVDIGFRSILAEFSLITNSTSEIDCSTLIVVHDEVLNELVRETPYGPDERQEALGEYERLMTSLEQTRFSILLLNALNRSALKVTHPRFFRGH